MDPTSACNLSCVGCWAAEYGRKYNLSYELLDSIIVRGKNSAFISIFSLVANRWSGKKTLSVCAAPIRTVISSPLPMARWLMMNSAAR